ncbi:hypothetical protein Pcac1_g5660 [Phytophthora cactorum]|uniref:Uncharacterized protein n=1 Tax=Phytophthora cactorum TaxID=29920 RepID=A0A8T1D5D9_9STRA|nr:hypothetical protein Pcac1_g5660 [Phytophthora cactorum]KAG2889604.1 hypothetical protein PC114_g17898 [Phytophthora cactorum]KAG2937167.1 hypothetical protein PC117_g11797 [Phytophthora cactorum]KAG3077517.1 hypothetical protein PC122_g13118 [Phytophthora cactorum]
MQDDSSVSANSALQCLHGSSAKHAAELTLYFKAFSLTFDEAGPPELEIPGWLKVASHLGSASALLGSPRQLPLLVPNCFTRTARQHSTSLSQLCTSSASWPSHN